MPVVGLPERSRGRGRKAGYSGQMVNGKENTGKGLLYRVKVCGKSRQPTSKKRKPKTAWVGRNTGLKKSAIEEGGNLRKSGGR